MEGPGSIKKCWWSIEAKKVKENFALITVKDPD